MGRHSCSISVSSFARPVWLGTAVLLCEKRDMVRCVSPAADASSRTPGDGHIPYGYRRAPSPTGNCKYRFLDLCFGVITGLFQLNMREIRQFVSRNHAVDYGRTVGVEGFFDDIV